MNMRARLEWIALLLVLVAAASTATAATLERLNWLSLAERQFLSAVCHKGSQSLREVRL